MHELKEIIEKLKKIKETGFVKTHRAGNTGVGKTLEDLLGIKENNLRGPNGELTELKSARKNTTSMITLFTKSPLPKNINSRLLREFGYITPDSKGRKKLETTVNALAYNTLRGKKGFKIDVKDDRIELVTEKNGKKIWLAYWSDDILREAIEKKFPRWTLYVEAKTKGKGKKEEFWYNEAWLLGEFNFNEFKKLLEEGIILVDIRIGQYPNGRPHDHGTAFRVRKDNLDRCFKSTTRVM